MSQFQFDQNTWASQLEEGKHLVLLDTDIGDDIDDALALALAVRSPEIELTGVTTVFGDTRLRARLAKHLLHTFERDDIPVAAGVAVPMLARHRPSGVPQAAILAAGDEQSYYQLFRPRVNHRKGDGLCWTPHLAMYRPTD